MGLKPTGWIRSRGRRPGEQFSLSQEKIFFQLHFISEMSPPTFVLQNGRRPLIKHSHCQFKENGFSKSFNNCFPLLVSTSSLWTKLLSNISGAKLYWYLWGCLCINIVNFIDKYCSLQTISSVPFPHSSLPKHDVVPW